MAQLEILGVGIAAVDDLLYIERYPEPNVKVPVMARARHGGGLVCTAMAAAASLGAKVAYVARFGQDDLSRYITGIMQAQGVVMDHLIADPTGQPYHSIIAIDQTTGGRNVYYDCTHYHQVRAEDLDAGLIQSAKVFFLDYLSKPIPLDLARKVKSLGVPIVADIEGRTEDVHELLALVDYLVVSDEFAQWSTGLSDLGAACAKLAQVQRRATVVTAGATGCYYTTGPSVPVTLLPAFTVKTTDTNGCGDTFHGTFAVAIARDWPLVQALLLASACGALKASGPGGWKSIPSWPQAREFMAQRQAAHPEIAAVLARMAG